jgi:diguanylate cyclase (GGDEF)-like protein
MTPTPPRFDADQSVAYDESARQAHRVRRYLMGVGTSLLVLLLMYVLFLRGELEPAGFYYGAAGMLFCFALFYGLFRSGMNRRMEDPSLTEGQIISSILVLTLVMYYTSSEARTLFHLIFLMSFLFGLFRLDTRALFATGIVAVAAYGAMVLALALFRPEHLDVSLELLRWGVITGILAWFAMMGGYMSRLRKELADGKAGLEKALETIRDMATRDELTGMHNRRFLMDALDAQQARSARTGEAFCVALADIDHFKKVNDTQGHAGGDAVLRGFAEQAFQGVRAVDQFGRYGGEEFMLVLTQTTMEGARISAERLRAATENIRFPGLDAEFRVTVSIGIAQHRTGEPVGETVKRADQALYRAKAAGRNRVECDN